MLKRDYDGQNCSIARALERVRYSQHPDRHEYRLTAKGGDLSVALTGLMQWGDKYAAGKPPVIVRRKSDKRRVVAALVPIGTELLGLDEIERVPGPGLKSSRTSQRLPKA